ncbi:MAG: dihydroorotate dehydrogenase electron transfer subunit [Candidatus Aminicenantes bacterium]|nr:dihydroorotate dehydrogenase electron transfer subunit [Candidatus Aminicenantes bacterium]HHF52193.1 dihydroorotate dehydrogenase electron transfer subunit [Candidatus Aminicenantes bacterium]
MLKNQRAVIAGKKSWGNDYFLFSLEAPVISRKSKPGQFLMVKITDNPYPLLRRPFSIHARNKHNIEIFFQNTGVGTSMLSQKQRGDKIEILGPLGNGFHIGERSESKKASLIGGGRGAAPLYFLACELVKKNINVTVFYGGKSSEDLPIASKFKKENIRTLCSTEDGSSGFKGLVTDLLETELKTDTPSLIYACGPEGMLKSLSKISKKHQIPAELSLESIMGCGFGACWGCVKKIKKGNTAEWHKVCEDGPVFSAGDIIWD